jgi:hypothetical protein
MTFESSIKIFDSANVVFDATTNMIFKFAIKIFEFAIFAIKIFEFAIIAITIFEFAKKFNPAS